MEKEISFVKKRKERKMYKELVICLIIIALIVGFNILTENNTQEAVKYMDEKLGKLEENILKNENEDNLKIMEEVMQAWKEKKDILEYYIEHDELEKVETELYELKAKMETKDYEEGLADIEKGIFILNHIKEKYKLRIQNIF